MPQFQGHQKRVTLSLGRCSAVCAQNPELMAVLQKIPGLGYDLDKLEKPELEMLYAEFDESLEEKIKAEFAADPSYLIDLRYAEGVCPLCGHVGCRWIFRLENKAGGQSIECGSECIISYGLNVMGAETAEHARQLLEQRIRQEIRKLQLESWHAEYQFSPGLLATLACCLQDIEAAPGEYRTQRSAWCKRKRDLPKLVKFYDRTGWLGTKLRWDEWRRLAIFARLHHPTDSNCVPYPREWSEVKGSSVTRSHQAVVQVPQAAPITPEPAQVGQMGLFEQPPQDPVYMPVPSDEPAQPVSPREEALPEVPVEEAEVSEVLAAMEAEPEDAYQEDSTPSPWPPSYESVARSLVFKE